MKTEKFQLRDKPFSVRGSISVTARPRSLEGTLAEIVIVGWFASRTYKNYDKS